MLSNFDSIMVNQLYYEIIYLQFLGANNMEGGQYWNEYPCLKCQMRMSYDSHVLNTVQKNMLRSWFPQISFQPLRTSLVCRIEWEILTDSMNLLQSYDCRFPSNLFKAWVILITQAKRIYKEMQQSPSLNRSSALDLVQH